MSQPTITAAQVNAELNADLSDSEATELVDYATTVVDQVIGAREVPETIRRRAILSVVGDEWALRQAPNGVRAFAGADGGVVRVSLDTTRKARRILRPWLGLGIG